MEGSAQGSEPSVLVDGGVDGKMQQIDQRSKVPLKGWKMMVLSFTVQSVLNVLVKLKKCVGFLVGSWWILLDVPIRSQNASNLCMTRVVTVEDLARSLFSSFSSLSCYKVHWLAVNLEVGTNSWFFSSWKRDYANNGRLAGPCTRGARYSGQWSRGMIIKNAMHFLTLPISL